MKSYKTTIAGFFVAFLNLVANGVSVRQALFSASMMILGLMAKDYDVSSGKISQNKKADSNDQIRTIDPTAKSGSETINHSTSS